MRRLLTRPQMRQCMTALRAAMDAFNRGCGKKLVFINDKCYYDHLRGFSSESAENIDSLLDIIEPYIPYALTDENFELFLRAAKDTERFPDEMPDYFTQKARVDFIAALRRAETPEQCAWLFHVCDAIRELKEDLAFIV